MARTSSRHRFKEMSLQQLRSFCETARLGSLAAAADSLGLSQPTVWEQVHALERVLATKLLERQARGSRLTAAGQRLVELAAPIVAGADALKRGLQESDNTREAQLTITATERTLADDLGETVVEFTRRHPRIRLNLLEMPVERVAPSVESGQADLGLLPDFRSEPTSPWLHYEPAYEMDLVLVTPADHPLARKRVVQPADLLDYPLINAERSLQIPDPAIAAALQKLGVYQTQPRRVEAGYSSVIRQYVKMGFGIGLVVALPNHPPPAGLHERSMSRFFGRIVMKLVRRKSVTQQMPIQLFADTLFGYLREP
jgi:molybdate transport repressor ModE-like protein